MAVSQQEKEKRLNSMSDAVKVVIDNYPVDHEFFGNQLKDDVVKIYPDAINMYPDTVLKMARRHRRDSYISIDRNNSLYKRVKSGIEILQEKIEQEKAEKAKRKAQEKNEKKSCQSGLSFNQGFLFTFALVFFVFNFGAVFALEAAFGRPLIPLSFIASKSASVYNPVGPIYLNGAFLHLCNLRFTASDDTLVPSLSTISSTVIPSMPLSIYRKNTSDQGGKCHNVPNSALLLYVCIVKKQNICKFLKISAPTLDNPLGQGYILYMFYCSDSGTLKKRLSEAPKAERHPIGVAKGDLYERSERENPAGTAGNGTAQSALLHRKKSV